MMLFPSCVSGPVLRVHISFEDVRAGADGSGDTVTKYYVVDGVDSLQKFGQDAW
jgi:hypothetical protein